MKHECNKTEIFNLLTNKLDSIENKIDKITAWKYKIIGAVTAIGLITSYAITIFR